MDKNTHICENCNYEFKLEKTKDSVEFCNCRTYRICRTNNNIHIENIPKKTGKIVKYGL